MNYEKPLLELIRSDSEDIIRTSTTPPTGGEWGDNDDTDFQ